MNYDEMCSAVKDAERTIRIAETQIGKMTEFISFNSRIRHAQASSLRRLKRELKNFNIQTGQWK